LAQGCALCRCSPRGFLACGRRTPTIELEASLAPVACAEMRRTSSDVMRLGGDGASGEGPLFFSAFDYAALRTGSLR